MMNIFKDNNDWNEKSIIGFVAFLIMCLIMIADLLSGWVGKDLIINEFVYNSFVWIVLGCFGLFFRFWELRGHPGGDSGPRNPPLKGGGLLIFCVFYIFICSINKILLCL